MLIGFILLRDTNPVIVIWSLILLVISFVSLFPSEKIVRITNPNFKFPDPQSKNYEQEYFNQFDDGEKFVILKGLYKLYGTVIWGLILLASALMFYSVFSGNSQVVSIIGIGILLLLIQVSYTMEYKPRILISKVEKLVFLDTFYLIVVFYLTEFLLEQTGALLEER